MRYKIGDYVLIDLGRGDVAGIGIALDMEEMQKYQPPKGLPITRIEEDKYRKRTFYKLAGTHWTFVEEWLRPARIYNTGGNV